MFTLITILCCALFLVQGVFILAVAAGARKPIPKPDPRCTPELARILKMQIARQLK